ncbi:hypothetical protein DFJ74DRAFT_437743, partial [Hyaloraphidium curvatum]
VNKSVERLGGRPRLRQARSTAKFAAFLEDRVAGGRRQAARTGPPPRRRSLAPRHPVTPGRAIAARIGFVPPQRHRLHQPGYRATGGNGLPVPRHPPDHPLRLARADNDPVRRPLRPRAPTEVLRDALLHPASPGGRSDRHDLLGTLLRLHPVHPLRHQLLRLLRGHSVRSVDAQEDSLGREAGLGLPALLHLVHAPGRQGPAPDQLEQARRGAEPRLLGAARGRADRLPGGGVGFRGELGGRERVEELAVPFLMVRGGRGRGRGGRPVRACLPRPGDGLECRP